MSQKSHFVTAPFTLIVGRSSFLVNGFKFKSIS